jgi:hypothetical protein
MTDYGEYVTDIVHEPSQSHDGGFDLTVAGIFEVVEPGRIDFGGGELEPAGTHPHKRTMRDPDDDYAWWHLSAGQYLLAFNESLTGEARVTLQPRTALLKRGASHPTVQVETLPRIPLSVGGAGLKLKENARVSTIVDADS